MDKLGGGICGWRTKSAVVIKQKNVQKQNIKG